MKKWMLVAALVAGVPGLWAQRGAGLSAAETATLLERTLQLMEAATIVVPGLPQAGAPAIENAKQALVNLKVTPGNSAHTYTFLSGVRAFLAVADATPKPFPFPAEGVKQMVELRENAERLEAHFRAVLEQKETQLRSPDRDNLRRYREANERTSAPAPGKPRVVFMGDSITDGWRLNEYFEGRDFVNRGISGQVTGEMLGRMQHDVIALKPKAMIVLAGTNDIARGVPLSTIESNLTSIADLADYHKIKLLFSSVLPVSDYHKAVNPRFEMTKVRPPSQIAELNRWLHDLCIKRRYTYVDYFSATADSSGALGADLADDGLHPNAKGYRLMAPVALKAIDGALKAVAAPVAEVEAPAGKRKK
jgi:lysophospholipase L1-like esterase